MRDPVRFGAFTLDVATRRLTSDGAVFHLTPKAFDLLVLLAQEAPRVVSKSELHSRLWRDTFVADVTLAGLVKEIRHVLREAGEQRPLVRTVHRVGYALDVVLEAATGAARSQVHHWLVYGLHHFVLAEGQNTVGREPPADIVLDSKGVSRLHARISVHATEALIEDLGSKNGTRVSGQELEAPKALASGDRIEFGTETVVFRAAVDDVETETNTDDPSKRRSVSHQPAPRDK